MANPLSINEHHQPTNNRNRKQQSLSSSPGTIPSYCGHSRTAVIDVVILIAVIGACGFLVYPYVKIIFDGVIEIGGFTVSVVKAEIFRAPMVYVFLGISMFFTMMAAFIIYKCSTKKCGKPNCLGLRKAAEFDIQIETEDCVKKSSSTSSSGVKEGSGGKGLFKLSIDRHRELEAELRKIAPRNGRAVLVFRARCGCSVGRMEVPGGHEPKKLREIKK